MSTRFYIKLSKKQNKFLWCYRRCRFLFYYVWIIVSKFVYSNNEPLSHCAIPSLVTANDGFDKRSLNDSIFFSFFKKSSGWMTSVPQIDWSFSIAPSGSVTAGLSWKRSFQADQSSLGASSVCSKCSLVFCYYVINHWGALKPKCHTKRISTVYLIVFEPFSFSLFHLSRS